MFVEFVGGKMMDKKFWEDSKEDLLKNHPNDMFYVFEKADEYYKKHFEQINLEFFREYNSEYDEKMQKIKLNGKRNNSLIKEKGV